MSVVSIMDVVCFDRALSHVIILKCKDNHTSDKKPATVDVVISVVVREVCRKSKWKFKMAFAIRRPTPPPLMAKFPDIFLPHFFSFAIESYIYETDFTLQKYHF